MHLISKSNCASTKAHTKYNMSPSSTKAVIDSYTPLRIRKQIRSSRIAGLFSNKLIIPTWRLSISAEPQRLKKSTVYFPANQKTRRLPNVSHRDGNHVDSGAR